MRSEEIKCCPFRIATETIKAMSISNGDITRMYFESCLKELCPAFYIEHGECEQEYERCKRLEK